MEMQLPAWPTLTYGNILVTVLTSLPISFSNQRKPQTTEDNFILLDKNIFTSLTRNNKGNKLQSYAYHKMWKTTISYCEWSIDNITDNCVVSVFR